MYIIAGLGNPAKQYERTRHNIGFAVIDRLADEYNITMDMKKHRAVCGKGRIEGQKVLLVKPQTYMNLSGESLREVMDFYKEDVQNLLVICDDVNFDVGNMRLRPKGSAGGHNGIKSIIAHLGTDTFSRIKIGVGKKPREYDLADWVLERFPKGQKAEVEEIVKKACKAAAVIITEGIDSGMNQYNSSNNNDIK